MQPEEGRDLNRDVDRFAWVGRVEPSGWIDRVGLALAIVAVIVVTVPRLGTSPLVYDESTTLTSIRHLSDVLRGDRGSMGVYYGLLIAWAQVRLSLRWLRAFSLGCAVATLPVVWLIGHRIGGRRIAAIAPVLLSLTWMFDYKAAEARGYALETFLIAVTCLAVIRVVDALGAGRAARGWTVVATLSGLLAVGTHGFAILFVGVIVLWALAAPIPLRRRLTVWPVAVVPLLGFAALTIYGLKQIAGIIESPSQAVLLRTLRSYTSFHALGLPVLLIVIGIAVVAALARWWSDRSNGDDMLRRASWVALLPVGLVAIPPAALLAATPIQHSFVDRFLSPASIGVALLLAMGVAVIDDAIVARVAVFEKVARIGPAALVVVALLIAGQPTIAREGRNRQYEAVVHDVSKRMIPGDAIAFTGRSMRTPFEAIWWNANDSAVRELVLVGVDVARMDFPDRLAPVPTPVEIAAGARSFDRIWLIHNAKKRGEVRRRHELVSMPSFTDTFTLEWHRQHPRGAVIELWVRKVPSG